jgi:hypothetical protein
MMGVIVSRERWLYREWWLSGGATWRRSHSGGGSERNFKRDDHDVRPDRGHGLDIGESDRRRWNTVRSASEKVQKTTSRTSGVEGRRSRTVAIATSAASAGG